MLAARSYNLPRHWALITLSFDMRYAKPINVNWNGQHYAAEALRKFSQGQLLSFRTEHLRNRFVTLCNRVAPQSCVAVTSDITARHGIAPYGVSTLTA